MANQKFQTGYLIINAATLLTIGATADTYTVSDELGWTIPPLEFRWNGGHSVAQVSKGDYDNCSNPMGTVQTTTPFSCTLNSTNPHYFVCTVGKHCSVGQKVTISTEPSAAVTASAYSAIFFTFAISLLSFM